MSVKLNIGAGSTVIPGFTAIDRKLGSEAFPLKYADNSVDEIRASHILEHFTFTDAQAALKEWTRVLKPGGKIRLAVPDLDAKDKADPDEWPFIVMGGQTGPDDFHRSAWDETRLRAHMEHFGLTNIRRWESPNTDTAAHPCSLNLEGVKAGPVEQQKKQALTVKVGAYLTLPRYEAVAARTIIQEALKPHKIDLTTTQGVFWGQCMQRMFQDAVDKNIDWILSLDSDSLFTSKHVSQLFELMAANPQIDAMAALQCRRGGKYPLLTTGTGIQDEHVQIDGRPIRVTTAHFGLTLIRVASLKQVSKPWFKAETDSEGNWSDDRLDDDIWFWHQWRGAGKNIYVVPSVSIGHLEETVAMFDAEMQAKHIYVHEWRKENGL
jgi:hypothetical protein